LIVGCVVVRVYMNNKEKEQIKNIIEHSKRKANGTPITFHNIFTKEQVKYIKKIDVEFWYFNKFII